MVGYRLYPLESKISWVWKGSSLSSTHSKSISPAPSATLLANASHPSLLGDLNLHKGDAKPPSSPSTAPLPLPTLPHTMHVGQDLVTCQGERGAQSSLVHLHQSFQSIGCFMVRGCYCLAAPGEGCGWCYSAAGRRGHGSQFAPEPLACWLGWDHSAPTQKQAPASRDLRRGEKQGWVVRGCLLPMAACHDLEMPCRGRKHLLAENYPG